MRRSAALTALVFSAVQGMAQTKPVTGRVVDDANRPVEGVSVTIKGSTQGVAADDKGYFRINAKPGDVLVFSALSFGSRELTVGAANDYQVSLARTTNTIDEVVVTALGIQRQRKDLGYATAKVNNAELTQAAPVNVASGLAGKVSGLNITTLNNGVFADVRINLRGIRSLTGNNNPMLLLDGIPVGLNLLNQLNPNDIQDVNILKGSSAAALYGPDARNGVIVVTTRKGARGGNPVINVSSTTQLEQLAFLPNFQEQFGAGGYGSYIPYENWSWGPAFDGTVKPLGRTLPDGTIQTHTYEARPDEKRKFFNTGVTLQNDISFAAKDFYFSVQDANVRGIVPGDKNRRTGIRVNTGREYGRFKVQFNVNYVQQNYDVFDNEQMSDYYSSQNVGLNDGLMNLVFSTPVNVPLTNYKDFRNDKFSTYNNYFNDYGVNPYFAIDNWRRTGRNDNLITNAELTYRAFDWLNFTYRAAATVRNENARGISRGEEVNAFGKSRAFNPIPGSVYEFSTRNGLISSEFFTTANKTFNDFKVSAVAGTYYRQNDTKASQVGTSGLIVPELFTVNNALGDLLGASSTFRTRLVSAYGSLGLGYKGWANLELTGRNDWTSTLAIGQNSFFYPGANLSLVLSDAIPFVKDSRTVSYLKVRGSLNRTGNADIAAYSLASTFAAQQNGFPYGTLPGYTANNTSFDPNLQPEFITSGEVGLELGLFKNRVNIELAAFSQNCTNQFVTVPVSNATGYTTVLRNAAAFVNRGLEMDLRLTPLFKFRKGNIDIRANAMYNNSEVSEVFGNLDRIQVGTGYTFAGNFAMVNQPAFVWVASDYQRDPQGRVIVDPVSGYPNKDPENKTFGRTLPLWIVGLTPSINWNGFTLTAVGEYRGGHYTYNHIGSEMAWTGISEATAVNNRERFIIPNSVYFDGTKYVPNNSIAVQSVNDFFTGDNSYRQVATNFLTSAASWRIREVALSYTLPNSIFRNFNVVKGVTISLNARNVALWRPKSNVYTDPDFTITANGVPGSSVTGSVNNVSGVSNATINPPSRIFGGTVNVRF